ncbi:MAG: aspartate--tRNA ligase [Anaerovoracaceae bacterium]|nr:aspartate--tRNA ligase [Anaerovoracaceae bacterium]
MGSLFKRTNMCGDLRKEDIGADVCLNGWIAKSRDLGGLVFCDVRDKTGITQVVFDDSIPQELFEKAQTLRSEYCVGVKGKVRARESVNSAIPTGDIEILASDLVIYSRSETPPIYVKDDDNVDMNLRLKYRYLDLRKKKMQDNLTFRSNVCKLARDYFAEQGFTEVETPDLQKPTPEGSRDYLVPSRIQNGSFYALPQSPQLFKQLLMVGGTDRYIQIARCFRDEDLRADRQPEFTQIDMEMSFIDEDDIIAVNEGFLKRLFEEMTGIDVKIPLPRLTWDEAMTRYGSDKPDTRFGFELHDLSGLDVIKNSGFRVFESALESGGDVRGICIEGGADRYSRKKIDKMTEHIRSFQAKGMVWIKKTKDGITSSVNKFFGEAELLEIAGEFDAGDNDLILIVADRPKVVFDSLGYLRRAIADDMGLLDPKQFNMLWVTDFPLFEYSEEEERYVAEHHPFTHPKDEDIPLIDEHPELCHARAYDIVINGVEAGGGSIRIHDTELQSKMFRALGMSDKEIEEKFGFLTEAMKFGAPPHGGLAYGLDRLVMLMLGEETIRDVIAFPKNQAAQCMVSGAPGPAAPEDLKELGLELIKKD